jgi:hypothetical protein
VTAFAHGRQIGEPRAGELKAAAAQLGAALATYHTLLYSNGGKRTAEVREAELLVVDLHPTVRALLPAIERTPD